MEMLDHLRDDGTHAERFAQQEGDVWSATHAQKHSSAGKVPPQAIHLILARESVCVYSVDGAPEAQGYLY